MLTGKIYDWSVGERYIKVNSVYQQNVVKEIPSVEVRLWCLEKETSQAFLVRIPYFYSAVVLVDTRDNLHNYASSWSATEIGMIKKILQDDINIKYRPFKCYEMSKYRLYEYDPNRYLMFSCRFYTKESLMGFYYNINKKQNFLKINNKSLMIWTTVHEHKIENHLKFLTDLSPPGKNYKFTYTSWIMVKCTQTPEYKSIATVPEFYLDSLRPSLNILNEQSEANFYLLDPEVTGCDTWIVYPKILSFDFETQPEEVGRFPKAEMGDEITMNSIITQRAGKKETRQIYFYIVGDCYDSTMYPNAIIIRCTNEDELIRKMEDKIREYDPDLIIGYNIDNYDFPYADTRLAYKGKKWSAISRIKDVIPKLIDLSWESVQSKFNEIHELDMEGRPTIDVYRWIRGEYRLQMYNLAFVSEKFLKQGEQKKLSISMNAMHRTYDIAKHIWRNESPVWNQQKRYVRPERPSNDYLNMLKELELYVDYTITDSTACLDIFETVGGWTVLTEISAVLGLPPRYVHRKGQTLKVMSQIYPIAHNTDTVLIDRFSESRRTAGGFCAHPTPGIYKFTFMIDFASMYPSIMREYNIDFRTLVNRDKTPLSVIPKNMCNVIDVDLINDKREIIGKTQNSFIKSNYLMGIIPTNVKNLIDERNKVKKLMGAAKYGTTEYTIYNARQNSIKVAANSNFGFLLRSSGQYTCQEAGESVTAKGRELILWCNKLITDSYNLPIVYNDTDSSTAYMPGLRNFKEGKEKGNEITKFVNNKLKELHKGNEILKVEMEKAMRMFIIGPKYYVYMTIDDNGNVDEDPNLPNVKGIPLARRDKPPMMNLICKELIYNIMIFQPLNHIYNTIFDYLIKIVQRQMNYNMFKIIQSLKSEYKSTTNHLFIFSECLQRRGKPARGGDRLEYIIGKGKKDEVLGTRLWLIDEYKEYLDQYDKYYNKGNIPEMKEISIDYDHYLEVIAKQLDKFFYIGLKNRIIAYEESRNPKIYLGNSKNGKNVFINNLFWMGYVKDPVKNFFEYRKLRFKLFIEMKKYFKNKWKKSYNTYNQLYIDYNLNKLIKYENKFIDLLEEFSKNNNKFRLWYEVSNGYKDLDILKTYRNEISKFTIHMWTIIPDKDANWFEKARQAYQDIYFNSNRTMDYSYKINNIINIMKQVIEYKKFILDIINKF